MTRIPVRIDPFFDGDGTQQHGESRVPQIPATPPRPDAYYDAAAARLTDGRPMTQVMRYSPTGLRGTIIPRSTMGGIPVGTRPHTISDLRVTIDPHIEGQSSVVRLGDVTAEAVESATRMAQEITPDPHSIETQRLRGAAVLHGVAAMGPAMQAGVAPAVRQPGFEGPTMPGNVPAPNLSNYARPAQVPQPAQRRVQSPLAAFNQQPPHIAEDGRAFRQIDLRGTPPELRGPTNPTVEVTFEIEHFGSHAALYHDVLCESGFIVLVYDRRAPGRAYFPPARDNSPPMAINVTGRSEVYLVHTTGFQYAYGDYDFCILMIERQATVPQEDQGPGM